MSAQFSQVDGRDYLETTLTSGLSVDVWKMMTYWTKREADGGGMVEVEVEALSESNYMRGELDSLDQPSHILKYNDDGQIGQNTGTGALAQNVWAFRAVIAEGSAPFCTLKGYIDGTSNSRSYGSGDPGGVQDLTIVYIGNGNNRNQFTRMEGKIADVALWLPSDLSNADSIASQLYNSGNGKRADNIAAANPVAHWTLTDTDQYTALTGPNLADADIYSPTWSSDHPTLQAPSGGVSTVQHVGHFV